MFVTIHEKTAQDFATLGLGTLVPISCEVEEELNGAFELELEHPYDEWGKWKRIEKGRIVVASTPRGPQPFRIYQIKPDMDTLKVNARHIFYDLLDNMVSLKYTGTAAGVLEAFQGAFNFAQPFTFDTDISLSGTMSVGKMNPVQALLLYDDEKYSGFIQTYGGELLRDGYHVSVKNSLGRDNGVAIRYGKNLTGLEITEDEEDVKTRIHLYNERGQSVTLDSPRIGEYPYPKIYIGEESSATQSELQAKAQELLNGGIDLPSVNIKVKFIPLAKTMEYAEFAILEEAHLGDVVTVVNQKMNFSKQAKVISYKWDCLLEQYEELELGDFMPTLATSVTSGARAGSVASNANATAAAVLALLQEHLEDFGNPHKVTTTQAATAEGTT